MKNKLLVFDLDGTLLNLLSQITNKSKEAIRKCKEKGYYIAYITGIGTIKIRKFIEDLPCDAYDCINASCVYCNEKH